jgi:two-component system phosphate regulon sensor histidine kinase PhoR
VAVFHDVTRVRELEALRRDFVANASHELRTPLAAIGGYVETLREVEMSEADRALFLTRVAAHTTRLTRLIDDLLDLSRMESGQTRLEIKPQPLAGPAARALQVVEALARARGVHLVNELMETLPPVIADERSMEQILVNLLDNAVKAVADGGRVALTARVDDGRVRVSVVDDGIGIPPGDIPRLFERFFRVDRSRSREQGGTGLGLAIVKHLVHLQGGEVGVESVVGQGSTFWFTLRASV